MNNMKKEKTPEEILRLKEIARLRAKNWYEANKEKGKETRKKYRENNKEKLAEMNKKWVEENLDKVKTIRKKYEENNRYKINEKSKIYRRNNPEAVAKRTKEWRRKNKEKFLEWDRNYHTKNPHIKAWRNVLHNTLRKLDQTKSSATEESLGYTSIELKEHIEKLFTEGMSWDNYGEWHIDHIKQIRTFDTETPMNVVNALSNLQPLWATTREINGIIYEGNLNKG